MTTSAVTDLSTIDLSTIPTRLAEMRTYFRTHVTKPYDWRIKQIQGLEAMVRENEKEWLDALNTDLGRTHNESQLIEILSMYSKIGNTSMRLSSWMRDRSVNTSVVLQPASSSIHYEPLGCILIVAPFNYPLSLMVMPLLAAISAGNCAFVKPSELTPAVSALAARLLPKYLDSKAFCVVEGAVPEMTELLKQRWDHIFFTGSEAVAKIVARAAAEHLTPLTLELGGKSPVIVMADTDIVVSAKRIIWAKCSNAGQTCIAPDHVYVEESIKAKFIEQCKLALTQFFPEPPVKTMSRIVNDRHVARLSAILDAHRDQIIVGGDVSAAERFIAPTLIDMPNDKGAAMEQEIFGPILPIISFHSLDTVLNELALRPKPLSLYAFTTSSQTRRRVLEETSSGGLVFNDCLMHYVNEELPFGGVGSSGMGSYHGRFGHRQLSHARAVLDRSLHLDAPQRYPPYTASSVSTLRALSNLPSTAVGARLSNIKRAIFG